MPRRLWPFSLFFVLPISAFSVQGHSGASTRLARIADEYWQHQLQTQPYYKLQRGETIDDLPDISESRAKAEGDFARHLLRELAAVKPAGLSHQDWLTLEILRWRVRQDVGWSKFYWLKFAVSPSTSEILIMERIFTEHPFRNQADLDHYLSLLNKVPGFFNQTHSILKTQVKRGIVYAKDGLPLVIGFISSYLQEPEKSTFSVEEKRLQALDPALTAPFREKIAQIIRTEINPVLQSLVDYLKGEYSQKAPSAVGLAQYPNGKDYYRFLVKASTTLDITPEEVHQIGLKAVEESDARMAELRRSMGFTGTRDEFHKFLRTDPRFFAKSPEEFEARLLFYIHRIEPIIPRYFSRIPKAPYGVKRIDPRLEQSQGFGHYEHPTASQPKGIYYYNGAMAPTTSLLFTGHLVLHELIPGHHFQMSLQFENTSLPEFRRTPGEVAFAEGWADYSAWLGVEMGIYENAYDLYGRLATDMRKSVRLVIDTGMNYMGWSRSKAMEYMREHTMDSDSYIESETLAEGVDFPGYWLGYKMGSRQFIELREKAQRELGNKFDIRQFHACVLENGSMPLDVLAKQVEWCVKNSN